MSLSDVETDEWIERVFGVEATRGLYYNMFERNLSQLYYNEHPHFTSCLPRCGTSCSSSAAAETCFSLILSLRLEKL